MRFRITTLDGGQGVAIHEMDALDEADAHRQALARGLRVLAIQAARLGGWRRARLALVAFRHELVALLAAGSLVVLFLVAYVVPRFSGIYEDIGGELPFASKMLMQWGRLLDAHGLAVLAGFLACVALAGYGVLRSGFRAAVGRLSARIPMVGHQIELYQLARLYRNVGLLLPGGLAVVTAFEMT